MTIKEWPQRERPREKLLKNGAGSLSDAELLAAIIGSGTKGHNALDIARALLSSYGNLWNVLHAERKQICKIKGFGLARFIVLQAAVEIVRRSLFVSIRKKDIMSCPTRTRNFLSLKMRDYEHEVFACMFLNARNHLIAFEEMFRGSLNGTHVHSREVVKRALYHNAASIIFVHNHPSGSHEPSESDEFITRELKRSLSLVDVRVLDHLVIGEKVTSFVDLEIL